ncbi:pyridoxal 5'-phosphate synthase glutaminase subunit PdxT [Thiotrichales bacterium 19S11-10]|nr:pyridoxal 5'-phosphate synthase glutaminase subunit PdxT [Thiotrichales bacterium 19S11-10]
MNPLVGILALQGNYQAHAKCLEKLDAEHKLIRKPDELSGIDGLIIPGGESGVILKHFEYDKKWIAAINDFYKQKKPILGTCAGIILLAKSVQPEQFSFGFLDIQVKRNAYGRQLQSNNDLVTISLDSSNKVDALVSFIRAPKIKSVLSDNVTVIATRASEVVGVREGHVFGLTCHPEYTTTTIHQAFLDQIKLLTA